MIYDLQEDGLAVAVPDDVDWVQCCTCGAVFFPGEINDVEGCLECGGKLFSDET